MTTVTLQGALPAECAVDSQTNATATATLAAAGAGFKWRVISWGASYSGAAVAVPVRATLAVGGVTRGFGVSTTAPWNNNTAPLDGTDNGTAVLTLAAGGVGAIGDVYLHAIRVSSTLGN